MSYGVAAGTLRDALTVRRGRTASRDAAISGLSTLTHLTLMEKNTIPITNSSISRVS